MICKFTKRFAKNGLILPGIFMLLLGVGNLIVGELKLGQYDQTMAELQALRPTPGPEIDGVLADSPVGERSSDRVLQRIQELKQRRDFYRVVSLGGQLFMLMSVIMFAVGSACWGFGRDAEPTAEPLRTNAS